MPRSLITLSLLMVLAGLAAPVAGLPIVFHADSPIARQKARDFQETWRVHGPSLVDDLVAATVPLDTVHCYVLPTDSFQRYFGDRMPDWGVGVALPPGRLIAVDYEARDDRGPGLVGIFMHEMTHALLFQAAGEARLPTWLHEGAAMRASGEWRFADTVSVALSGRVPSLVSLTDAFPRGEAGARHAYRTSLAAVTFLEREHGPGAVPRIVSAARKAGDYRRGFLAATGEEPGDFARRFGGTMQRRYGWVLMIFRWPTMFVIMAVLFLFGAGRKIVLYRLAMRADAASEAAEAGTPEDPRG